MSTGISKTQADGSSVTGHEADYWRMADALRGSMDAAEYKHVVLGLIFLKYISDAFEEAHGAAGIVDYVDDFLFDGVYVLTGEDGSVVDADGHPVVQYIWGQFWVNNHAHVLKGKNGVSEEHLYLLLHQANISAFVTGAVQPKLSQRNLKAVPIVFASRSVCGAFSDIIRPLFKKMRVNADETESLAALRDAILSKLVSGKVRLDGLNELTRWQDGE